MEKLRILFTGDSITDVNRTDMVRMTEEWMSRDPNATPQQREEAVDRALGCGYPLLVASQLGAQEPGRYEFLNRGISGNRVVDLDARIKRDCINLRPDVISILIGVNDVWHELGEHNGVDAPKFRRVYEGMLQEITHALPGVKLILLEPYVLQGPATLENWDTFRQEVDLRREVVRDLAKSYWEKQDLYIPCIDTQKLFDEAAARSCPGVWSADGVHPTPAGHWLLAQEWLRCFKEL
ncbi:MAG: SGNH/GDSL hydrolase family protein [Acutalibacter sp.]